MIAVLLGLLVSMTYGTADFLGGFASRRANTWVVVLGNQVVGLFPALLYLVLLADQGPQTRDVLLSAFGGLAGVGGIGLLFHGLAVGRMAVVAPVSAGVGGVLPVVWGLLNDEHPGALGLAGVVVTLTAAVVLARSETPTDGEAAKAPVAEGVVLAVGAGLLFGTVLICFSETGEHVGMWPVVIARMVAIPVLAMGLAIARQPFAVPPDARRLVAGSGVLDATAAALLLVALREDLVSLVAPASNLYPAATVMLARFVLHEHLTRGQLLGLGVAAVGLVFLGLA
jgi:drug/metabolite transporter (DMT)-like permease